MESNYNTIANLVAGNIAANRDQGLFSGNMGLCIFLYHASKQSNNSDYEQLADDLLDKIFGSLYTFTQPEFENGLAGIGWGIEYLVQNGFAEGDTDLILADIDTEIFKKLTQNEIKNIDLQNGLTGYLYYLVWRLKVNNSKQTTDTQINRELLMHVVNKIDEYATLQLPSIVEDICFDLLWAFPVMFYGLYEAYKLNIYNEKITRMVKQWLTNFEVFTPFLNINKIYLATTMSLFNKVIPDNRLEKQARLLMYSVDYDELLTEVDTKILNVWLGWTGFVWLLEKASDTIPTEYPNHQLLQQAADVIRKRNANELCKSLENSKTENLALGLANGIAGIGLFELLYPTN